MVWAAVRTRSETSAAVSASRTSSSADCRGPPCAVPVLRAPLAVVSLTSHGGTPTCTATPSRPPTNTTRREATGTSRCIRDSDSWGGRAPAATPGHLSVLYRELLTSGRRHRPGGLAPKTVRNVHVLIHRVLKDAVRWGYVVRNVADAADPPKVKPAELQVWSPGQLRAFLAHVEGDRQYAAWLLAATTGMRRGELLGCVGSTSTWTPPASLSASRAWCRPRRSRLGAEDDPEPAVDRARPGDGGRPARAPGGRPGSGRPGVRGLRAGLYPSGTARRSIPSGSPTGSGSTFAPPGCRRSACMTCATAMQPRRSPPAFRPRSSVNGSGTRPSPSRWTPTATSCLAWTSEPPPPWRG